MPTTYKYLLILAIAVFAIFGVYRIYIGKPDHTLFIVPVFMIAFYLRKRGMDRAQRALENQRKGEQ